MWEKEGRCEVLYNYYDYLQNEVLSQLSENNQLILQPDNKHHEVCESFKAIKIYCNKISEKQKSSRKPKRKVKETRKIKRNFTCGICLNNYFSFDCTSFLKGQFSRQFLKPKLAGKISSMCETS